MAYHSQLYGILRFLRSQPFSVSGELGLIGIDVPLVLSPQRFS